MSNLSFNLFGEQINNDNDSGNSKERGLETANNKVVNKKSYKNDVLVLDLETQNSFSDVGGRDKLHLLKISVVGVYSYNENKFLIFEEKDFSDLEERMKKAANTIGFNIKDFDFPVLQSYFKKLDLKKIPYFDIMEDLVKIIGRRLPLNAVAEGTLGTKKIADGLQAIKFFREGDFDSLNKYCLSDVKITRDVYEYGKKHNIISFKGKEAWEEIDIPVRWG